MKSILYERYGSLNELKLKDIEEPVRGKEDVLVKMKAFALNPRDVSIRNGDFKILTGKKFPKQIGADFSGEVIAVPEQVSDLKIGDEVFGYFEAMKTGISAGVCSVPVKFLTKKPSQISHEMAASLPCTYLTALQVLRDKMKIIPGKQVMIYGASGGVGTAAIQLAKHLGAEVFAVSNSKNKDYCMNQGADHFIAYNEADVFSLDVKVDAFFQVFSKNGLVYSESKKVLKKDGKFVCLVPNPAFIFKKLFARPAFDFLIVKAKPKDLDYIGGLVVEGKLNPRIDHQYPMAEFKQAYDHLENKGVNGKIVVKMQ